MTIFLLVGWFNLKKMRKNINQFMVKKLEKKLFQIRFNFRKRMRNLKLVKIREVKLILQ